MQGSWVQSLVGEFPCGVAKKKKVPLYYLLFPFFFLFRIKIEYLETQGHFVALITEVIILKRVEQLEELQRLRTVGLQYQLDHPALDFPFGLSVGT